MDYLELRTYLRMGREIEFSFQSTPYFMSKIWGLSEKDSEKYFIRNCKEGRDIFIGELDDLLLFEFCKGVSLRDNLKQFVFEYIF